MPYTRMSITDFDEALAFKIRVASALENKTPSRYVRNVMERVTSELAAANPFVRNVYESRPLCRRLTP
jgi:hypothetical protein